ncbi:MAG: hypothetical protein ACRYG5_13345 [Janthinobacterium lividum]
MTPRTRSPLIRSLAVSFSAALLAGLSCAPASAQETNPDSTWSASALRDLCAQTSNAGRAECRDATRGLIRGYQYGVLFQGRSAGLSSDQVKAVSLCLDGVPLQTLADEFVHDAAQVNEASLSQTPAEVAFLGSVHLHHSCN